MSKALTGCFLLVGLAGGAAFALAYRISRDTGKDLPEAFKAIPSEFRRCVDDVRGRVLEAVSVGRQAAAEKQREIQDLLAGDANGTASAGIPRGS
jgi:hypothetical protein